MSESFEVHVTANWDDICGAWTLHGQCGEKTALRLAPIAKDDIWQQVPRYRIAAEIRELILELRESGPNSAVENRQ